MFTVVVYKAGAGAREITPVQESLKFTTAAIGGFGQCTFNVVGDRRRDVPKLATVRVMYGTALAWEGRVEDHGIAPADDPVITTVTCFGLQRRLTDVSVRRIWSKRDLNFLPAIPGYTGPTAPNQGILIAAGAFDPSNPTRVGVGASGKSVSVGIGEPNYAQYFAPAGTTIVKFGYTFNLSGANTGVGKLEGLIQQFTSAGVSGFLSSTVLTASQADQVDTMAANCAILLLGAVTGATLTITPTDVAQFYNLRILGTALVEDAAGGFYGGTILNDLIALVPGLTIGIIEQGSDYTIAAVDRAIRDTSLSVVSEVAGYYNREWAVWEDGRFDWRTPNLDEPQWIVPLEQMLPGTHIETSIDTLASQIYVLFSEALDGASAEQAAAATDARNPLVKAGLTKDELLQAPAVMTDNTAAQLATIEAARQLYAPATGTLVLSATALIQNAVGTAKPAALIRAGTNVYLPGLPKTDSVLAPPARDGETLFHIAETELDMELGTITLSLEGQAREIDVITARLAAATRVVTG